ncbi:uncharacterized protein si:ch73-347e22.4 isoform X2 [Myxocyprinus asiaticus]|uniref:uncharacterized protein si:ch73-347e22.4 isoform X2 n=1 Tax=Myxocyprinus asiaticus TaxID=70543 RepID=UPI00222305D1|nr:uncharacterized protein si:ch73-347e22.4 isoform X2 [Myxocyprinus asiaticus]XP_051526453.1 uncharacterized protein si:ch73-347e22.4 isoform X2 [Myxocyprinus asiaticus]XP_051526454.1 uncharacterized protein si:ch73-347e22.4 isoform X2 [Myxocyprinus asiaticus]
MDGTAGNYGERTERFPHSTWPQAQSQGHDMIGGNFAAGESMPPLSSCMSGAFKALLPDYHEPSSAMTTNSVRYSYSLDNRCLLKSGTEEDYGENIAVERMQTLNDQELDPGNPPIWTSVIKDALEMSNGMEMEQSLAVDVCAPLVDLNPVYKTPQTDEKITLKKHCQIADSRPKEKLDGEEVKGDQDCFVTMLSDGISKQQDVLEMGKNQEQNIFAYGSSTRKEELGLTGIRVPEPAALTGFNRSSYVPFSSSKGNMKCEGFSGIPLVKQSVEHTLLRTEKVHGLSCKDGSPRKTLDNCMNVNNETFPESSTVYGLNHLNLQKGILQEVTDGKTVVNFQTHPLNHNVQDERVNQIYLHVSDTTLIKPRSSCLPTTPNFISELENQVHNLVPSQDSDSIFNLAVVECENSKLRLAREEQTLERGLSVPEELENEASINTENAELSLKVKAKCVPAVVSFPVQNSSSVAEIVQDLPAVFEKMHTDHKCKDSQTEQEESDNLNKLCFQEKNSKNEATALSLTPVSTDSRTYHPYIEVKSSENREKTFPNNTAEISDLPSAENVQAALPSPSSRIDCSTQHNLKNAFQKHRKLRKRKKSEPEELIGQKSTTVGDCSMYGSEISDSAVKPGTTGCEEANRNCTLADHDSTALKEKDLIKNDVIPQSRRKPPKKRKIMSVRHENVLSCHAESFDGTKSPCDSQLQISQYEQLEDKADKTETSQKLGHSFSDEKVTSGIRQNDFFDNKAKISDSVIKSASRKKNRITRLCLKAKNSAAQSSQSLSQSTGLSPEEDYSSHSQVSNTILGAVKAVNNAAQSASVNQQAISILETSTGECSPEKAQKLRSKKTLQTKNQPPKTVQGKCDSTPNICKTESQLEDVPTTISKLEEDLVGHNVKKHKKTRRPTVRASRVKNEKSATTLDISLPDSVSPTDSVSTSVSDSSNILSPQNNPKKARQKKKDINKAENTLKVFPTMFQQEDIPSPLSKSRGNMVASNRKSNVKAKRPVIKTTRKDQNDDCDTALIPTSTASLKHEDFSGTEVEPPFVLTTKKKSRKKKWLGIQDEAVHIPEVDQKMSQPDVLTLLSESDAIIVSPNRRRFRTRKTLAKTVSHSTVSKSYEAVHLIEPISSANGNPFDTVSAKETDSSDVLSQQNTEKTSSKRKKKDKHITAQMSTISQTFSQQEDVTAIPSKSKTRNKISDIHLNDNLVEETSLSATVKQENSISPLRIDSSSSVKLSSTLKKSRKKTKPAKKAIRQRVKNNHPTAPLDMQTSTTSLKQSECVSAIFTLTPKKYNKKKMSDIQGEAVHIPAVDQTMPHQETLTLHSESDTSILPPHARNFRIPQTLASKEPSNTASDKYETSHLNELVSPATGNPADSASATETDYSDVLSQQNSVKTKRSTKKATRRKTHVKNVQSEDHAEHPTVLSALSGLPSPISLCKDATADPISVIAEDVVIPQRSLKKTKKAQGKKLLKQKVSNSSPKTANIIELAHREEQMSGLPSVLSELASENFETLKADSCDQNWKISKKKLKQPKQIAETHGLASVSLSQEMLSSREFGKTCKTTEIKTQLDEAGVMDTNTAMQDFCTLSDVQYVEGSQWPKEDGYVVDQKDITIKQETIKDLKAPKTQRIKKTKNRKTGKKKRKMAGLLTRRVKDEEQRDIFSDKKIACDVQNNPQTPLSDNSSNTAVITEEAVLKSNVFISRKSTRIQNINSGPVFKNLSTQFNSTVSSDVTDSLARQQETLSSSMYTVDCEGQHTGHGISISVEQKSPNRGRRSPIKSKKLNLSVAHLDDNTSPIQISDLSSLQGNTENSVKAAATPVKQKVVRPLVKRKAVKKKNVTVTKQLGADLTEFSQSVTDQTNNTPLQIILATGSKKEKNFKRPTRNLELTCLRESSRASRRNSGTVQGFQKTDITHLPQNSTKVFKKVELKTSLTVPDVKKRKLLDKDVVSAATETFQNKATMVGLQNVPEELNEEKHGRKRQKIKEPCFADPVTEHGELQRLKTESKNNKTERIHLDTKIKAYTELKCTQEADTELSMEMSGEKLSDYLPETSANKVDVLQPSKAQKADGHVAIYNKFTNNKQMGSQPKEKRKKPLTCKYCGISFRHITAYVIHQRIHTGEKPYKCRFCGKTFAQLSKLNSHRNVHKQHVTFPCPCCSQKFLHREDLICHFKIHLQESKVKNQPEKDNKSKRDISSDASSKTRDNFRCLICKFCNKNFVNQVKLQSHMQIHEVEKPMTCKDCGKKFWKPSSLAVHEKIHWPVKPYACSVCGKGFDQLKALKMHSQGHTGETPFSCCHCGHAFSALSALRTHQASKMCIARRNAEENSDIAGFIVSQGVVGQVNTPVFFKCQICKQLLKKWCQYTLHLQTHTSSSPYLCFSCGQSYEKDSEITVHCEVCCQSSGEEKTCGASLSEIMQGVTQTCPEPHSISGNSLQCTSSQSLPSTEFQRISQTLTSPQTSVEPFTKLPQSTEFESTQTRASDLSYHLENHSNQSPIELPIAKSPTPSETSCTSFDSSLECIEISPSLWKFQCSRCGQRFKRYRFLCAHMQTHAPGFRYTCAHCGQFFERWNKLWLHQRCHRLKGRCYSCTQCNLQFNFFSSYKEHMFDHAGQRPYACPLCPKTFIQEDGLHAHQCESHKLCKSLKCDVCSKTFSSLRNLIKHSLLHNGATSHVCLLCNLSFTNTRALQEHLKTHTSLNGPPLPDIPSKPLSFPHKCKRCKASFSTGDLLYAHQICHSRFAKTEVRPAVESTSQFSDSSHNDTESITPFTCTNHISNLKLDGIPSDKSLYAYSHPDRLYVTPQQSRGRIPVINLDSDEHEVSVIHNTSPEFPNSNTSVNSEGSGQDCPLSKERIPVINLDSDEHEISDSHNTSPEIPNSNPSANIEGSRHDCPVVTTQSDSTHLPQTTSGQYTTNLKSSESIKGIANDNIQDESNYSCNYQRKHTILETSVDMELETSFTEEESEERFECVDCTEKLTSVLGLYEHYILHAMGDTYVH